MNGHGSFQFAQEVISSFVPFVTWLQMLSVSC